MPIITTCDGFTFNSDFIETVDPLGPAARPNRSRITMASGRTLDVIDKPEDLAAAIRQAGTPDTPVGHQLPQPKVL